MNIAQIKEIWDLEKLLSHLGFEPDPKKSRGHSLFYKSPFRPSETKPSFRIDTRYDIWKDYGLGEKGGDLILFAQKYLAHQGRSSNVKETLAWFRDLSGSNPMPRARQHTTADKPATAATNDNANDHLEIIEDRTLIIGSLIQNLKNRKISIEIAKSYLRQIKFQRAGTPKELFGYGFANRSGGIEFSNPLGFKTSLLKKDISIIAGQDRNHVEVYEGSTDFLTRLSIQNSIIPPHDIIVLNTIEKTRDASEFISAHKYHNIYLWLDNDKGGATAEEILSEELHNSPASLISMSLIYEGYKDFNEWHVKSNLSPDSKKLLINKYIQPCQPDINPPGIPNI